MTSWEHAFDREMSMAAIDFGSRDRAIEQRLYKPGPNAVPLPKVYPGHDFYSRTRHLKDGDILAWAASVCKMMEWEARETVRAGDIWWSRSFL